MLSRFRCVQLLLVVISLSSVEGFAQDQVKPKPLFRFTIRSNFLGSYVDDDVIKQRAYDNAKQLCSEWRETAAAALNPRVSVAECEDIVVKKIYRVIAKDGVSQLAIAEYSIDQGEQVAQDYTNAHVEMLGYVAKAHVFVASFDQEFSGFSITRYTPSVPWKDLSKDDIVRALYDLDQKTAELCRVQKKNFARGGDSRLITCNSDFDSRDYKRGTFYNTPPTFYKAVTVIALEEKPIPSTPAQE